MLRLNNISKTFQPGTVNEKHALKDVDLHLAPGEFVTVLGSNGAGKSTLMGAIAGSFQPDRGSVILDGKDITRMPEHRRSKFIGRLFQDPLKGTAPGMTIGENLALAYLRASHGRSPFSMITAADRRDFRERLARLGLGLEDRMDQPVGLLSGGQRQALTLLMATLVTPKLLLLDEHTAALDPATAEKVLGLTKEIVEENGIACLMITHSIPSALELGSRTVFMNEGRIVMELAGERRQRLTEQELLQLFRDASMTSDRILLSR
jgi:putative ABC transport system ATP-binding protein